MHDPTLAEACRAYELRFDVWRRLQRYLRDEVDPKLAQFDALKAENEALKAQLDQKKGKPVAA